MAARERAVISQLEENTTYYFKIQLQYDDEDGLQSDVSDPISTIADCVSVLNKYASNLLSCSRSISLAIALHGPPPQKFMPIFTP